jgi:hypothetical protein
MPEDAMGFPIPTTIVLTRPAPGEGFQDRVVITVGVGKQICKFVLNDAYTNHAYVEWSSIWEQARFSNPNLNAAGADSEKFTTIEPGTTVTVSGMYKAAQRTFEVLSVEEGDRFRHGEWH